MCKLSSSSVGSLLAGLLVPFLGAGRTSSGRAVESPPSDLRTFDDDLDLYHSLLQVPGMAVGAYRSGRIHEPLGNADQTLRFYQAVADSASFFEQPVKHRAYLELGEYYARSDPERAKPCLEVLIRYKDMIGVQDEEYQEARLMLGSFETH